MRGLVRLRELCEERDTISSRRGASSCTSGARFSGFRARPELGNPVHVQPPLLVHCLRAFRARCAVNFEYCL